MCHLSPSLQFAVEELSELERWKQELLAEAHTLIDFFCEDKDTVKLDECLQIFRDFCIKFNKAVKVRLEAPLFSELLGFFFFLFLPSPLLWHKGGGRKGWLGPHGQPIPRGFQESGPAISAVSISISSGWCSLCHFAVGSSTCSDALKAFC